MPTVVIELDESHKSITRPATLGVVQRLLKMTGLPANTPINYPGASGAVQQAGSAIGDVSDAAYISTRDLVTIEVTEDDLENAALTAAVTTEDNIAVFADHTLDVIIKPFYRQVETSINFIARFKDRSSAEKWRNQFKRSTSMMRLANIHEISYHWDLPPTILIILYQIHACREAIAPYGETLQQWLLPHSDIKLTALVDQAGNNALAAIAETQAGVVGWFDFEGQPDSATYNQSTGTWESNFVYKFRYNKPISAVIRYPLMVHNQVLNAAVRPSELPYELDKLFRTESVSRVLFDCMLYHKNQLGHTLPGISIPAIDDWLPRFVHDGYCTILRIMIALDPNNLKLVMNLEHELGVYSFNALLLQYMKDDPTVLQTIGESIVNVNVHGGWNQLSADQFTIAPDLSISAINDLSLRTPYHVHVTLLVDVWKLSASARARLQNYGALFLAYAAILDPTLVGSSIWPTLTANGFITTFDFNRLMERLAGPGYTDYINGGVGKRLVGYYGIISARGEPHANS